MPPRLHGWILLWLKRNPRTLQQLISCNDRLLPHLLQEFSPAGLAIARQFISREERAALARLRREDLERELDQLLQDCPEAGGILWVNADWYYAQMEELIGALLGR